MTEKLNIKTKVLTGPEYAAFLSGPKMSAGEQAARLYLGRKQVERAARLDRNILIAYGLFALGALASPFIIFWGV